MDRIGIELGDHLGPEHLEHLVDLVLHEGVRRQPEHQLVTSHRLVRGRLFGHLIGLATQHPTLFDEVVEHRLVGDGAGALRPYRDSLLVGNGVVVVAHQRVEVPTATAQGNLAGPLPVVQTNDRIGHHHVVVLELPQWLGAVGHALFVGVDATLEVVDGLEVEGNGTDAELAGLGEGTRVAATHPDGRVALALVGLGQNVVRVRHREVLPLEHVVLLLPHPRDLADDFVPLGFGGVLIQNVEGGDLVAAGSAAGAPLEASLEDVIEQRHPLGRPHRVVDPGGEVHDAGTDMDALGSVGQIAHHHFG